MLHGVHIEKYQNEIVAEMKYRKIGICSRGYYYFWRLFGVASNQGRLLFEGGYYSNYTNLT